MNSIRNSSSSRYTTHLLGEIFTSQDNEFGNRTLISKIYARQMILDDYRSWIESNEALINKSTALKSLVTQINTADPANIKRESYLTHAIALLRFGANQLQQIIFNWYNPVNHPPNQPIDPLVTLFKTTSPAQLGESLCEYLNIEDKDCLKDNVTDLLLCIKSQIFNQLIVCNAASFRLLFAHLYNVLNILIEQKETDLADQLIDGVIELLCTDRRIRPYDIDAPLSDPDILKAAEPFFNFLVFFKKAKYHPKFIHLIKFQRDLCNSEGYNKLIYQLLPIMTALSEHGREKYQLFIRQILALTNYLENKAKLDIFNSILPLLLKMAEAKPNVVYKIITLDDEENNKLFFLKDNFSACMDLLLLLAKKDPIYIEKFFSNETILTYKSHLLDFVFKSSFLFELEKINQDALKRVLIIIDKIINELGLYENPKYACDLMLELSKEFPNQLLGILTIYPELALKKVMIHGNELLKFLVRSENEENFQSFLKILSTKNWCGSSNLHSYKNFKFAADYLIYLTEDATNPDLIEQIKAVLATQDEEGNTIIHSALQGWIEQNKYRRQYFTVKDPLYILLQKFQTKYPSGFVDLILTENKRGESAFALLNKMCVVEAFIEMSSEICLFSATRLILTLSGFSNNDTRLSDYWQLNFINGLVETLEPSNDSFTLNSIQEKLAVKIANSLKCKDNYPALIDATKSLLHLFKENTFLNILIKWKKSAPYILMIFSNSYSVLEGKDVVELKIEIIDMISKLLKYNYNFKNQDSTSKSLIDWKLLSRLLLELICLEPKKDLESFSKAIEFLNTFEAPYRELAVRVFLDIHGMQDIFFKASYSSPHLLVDLSLKATEGLVDMLSNVVSTIYGDQSIIRLRFEELFPLLSLLGQSNDEEKEEVFVKCITITQKGLPPLLFYNDIFFPTVPVLIKIARKKPSCIKGLFKNYNSNTKPFSNPKCSIAALPLLQELDKASFEHMMEIYRLNHHWDPFVGDQSAAAYLPWLTEMCKRNPKDLMNFLLATSVIHNQEALSRALPALKMLFLKSSELFLEFLQHLNLDSSFKTLLPLMIDLVKEQHDPHIVATILLTETKNNKTFFESGDNIISLRRIPIDPQLKLQILSKALSFRSDSGDE